MKAWFIIATTAFSCILPVTAIAPSKALNQSPVRQEPNHNVRTNWYSEMFQISLKCEIANDIFIEGSIRILCDS